MQGVKYLAEDIIINILSRLPAKFVGRCRCVCKHWKALLSQSHFIKIHLNRNKQLPLDLLISSSISIAGFEITNSISLTTAHHLFDKININCKELSYARHPDNVTYVFASCDGLILACNGDMFLIIPTTQEIREVPSSPLPLDPENSGSVLGFGYDSVSNDYKIVKLSYFYGDTADGLMFVDVYSVRHGTWKRVERSPYIGNNDKINSGTLLHGYLHGLVMSTDYKLIIAAFDLAEEKFSEVPLPKSLDSKKYENSRLCVLGSCLCLYSSPDVNETCDWSGDPITTESDIWVMKVYGVEDSWTKFTIIDREGGCYEPLCVWGQERVVLVKIDADGNELLMVYNLEAGSLTDIVVHGIADCRFILRTFMESLVSPHYFD